MVSGTDPAIIRLVEAVQRSDQVAFAALYRRYGVSVFRTAYLLLGDSGRAEEVTQDVCVRLYRKLGDFHPDQGAFTAWLYRITVSVCANARRRWWPWFSLEQAYATGFDPPSIALPPIELTLREEERPRIWLAIQQLSLKLRTTIVLRYYHDLSYEEIAQVLDCPVGTVRSRLNVAQARLRNILEG